MADSRQEECEDHNVMINCVRFSHSINIMYVDIIESVILNDVESDIKLFINSVIHRNSPMVILFLTLGFHPCAYMDNETAFHSVNSRVIADIILEMYPNVINVQHIENGYTLLHCAAAKKNMELLKFLEDKGADLDIVDKNGKKAYDLLPNDIASIKNGSADIESVCEIFNEFGENKIIKKYQDLYNLVRSDAIMDGSKAQLLANAINNKEHFLIILYLEANYNPLATYCSDELTPFHSISSALIAKLVLDKYPTIINAQDEKNGYTLLHYAVKRLNLNVINFLFVKGASQDIKGNDMKLAKEISKDLIIRYTFRKQSKKYLPEDFILKSSLITKLKNSLNYT